MDPDDGPPIVCRVTPDGDVVCEPATMQEDMQPRPEAQKGLEALLKTAYDGANWGPNKVQLALSILEVLNDSRLPDEPNIPRRSGEIVDTVKLLLAKTPPSIVLYNYSTQPADVVGAYFLNKAQLVNMQQLYKEFATPHDH